jgi:hypothetical protein
MKVQINQRTSFHLYTLESELEDFLKELMQSQSKTQPDLAVWHAQPAAVPPESTTSEPTA